MPAKDVSGGRNYHHVYNCGVENRTIFEDAQDYQVFQDFLSGYLNPPTDPESTKKVFTINGKSFRGSPHQPKNYFGKIELVSSSFMPDHFHLILDQKTPNSLENLMRSLCTRYSMYFNKKYSRTGSLFQGPYRSAQLKGEAKLEDLTKFISHKDSNHLTELPENITLEKTTKPLAKRDLSTKTTTTRRASSRITEVSVLIVIFLVLFGTGYRNVNFSNKKIADLSAKVPKVLSESSEQSNATPIQPSIELKTMVVVKITNEVSSINIREKPSTESAIITEAKNGDKFEFVSENSGWYEVKLPNYLNGFIFAKYTYLEKITNNE